MGENKGRWLIGSPDRFFRSEETWPPTDVGDQLPVNGPAINPI